MSTHLFKKIHQSIQLHYHFGKRSFSVTGGASPPPQNVMGWDVRGCSVALGTLVNVPNTFSKRKPHKEESGSCHNTHTMGRKNSGNPTGHNSNKPKRKPRLVHTTAPVVSTHPATSNYVPPQFQTNEQKTNDLKKILKIVQTYADTSCTTVHRLSKHRHLHHRTSSI